MTLFITGVKPSGQAKLEVSKNHALARGYLFLSSKMKNFFQNIPGNRLGEPHYEIFP